MAAPESTTPAGPSPPLGPGGTSGNPALDAAAKEHERLLDSFRLHILHLERIMDVVEVSVMALFHQHADQDVEVARVLRSYASNKLCLEIEAANKLLKSLKRGSRESGG
jgi:hypothetical protein